MASINGFDVVPYRSPKLAKFLVPGATVRLSVRKEVAPLLIGLARDFHATVERLDPDSTWGHAPRKIANSNRWSYHAPGIALDLNAAAHPDGKRGTFSRAKVRAIRALLAQYRFQGKPVFRWGGDFGGSDVDEMHFQLITPRANALRAVKALQTSVPVSDLPVLGTAGGDMRNLVFGKSKSSTRVYVGDGVACRGVAKEAGWKRLMDEAKRRGASDDDIKLREFNTDAELFDFIGKKIG